MAKVGRVMRGAVASGCAAALMCGGCNSSSGVDPNVGVLPSSAKAPPNIIFILIDTLRADRLGAYGHKGNLTPNLDALAAEGVLFEHCESQAPWTLASVGSIFCSCYPSVHKAMDFTVSESMRRGERPKVTQFSDEFDTLAEALHALGYETAGVSANPFIIKEFGFAQGFDYFDNDFTGGNGVKGSEVNERALRWLDQRKSQQPMFLYLHYMDAHGPYDAPGEFADAALIEVEKKPNKRTLTLKEFSAIFPYLKDSVAGSDPERFRPLQHYWEYWVAAYEAGVREADHHIGAMVAELKKRGLWENSYVILTADHGEALCEHGYWEHGFGLYETELHVPLILRWPGVLPKGQRIGEIVETFDIMPTLFDQLRHPLGAAVQGRSLLGLMQGQKWPGPGSAFAEANKHPRKEQWALRRGNYKVIRTIIQPDPNDEDSPQTVVKGYELYDSTNDPDEQKNLIDEKYRSQDWVNLGHELTLLLDAQISKNAKQKPGLVVKQVDVNAQQQNRLVNSGYTAKETDESTSAPTTGPVTRPETSQSGTAPASQPGSQPTGARP